LQHQTRCPTSFAWQLQRTTFWWLYLLLCTNRALQCTKLPRLKLPRMRLQVLGSCPWRISSESARKSRLILLSWFEAPTSWFALLAQQGIPKLNRTLILPIHK
jgi:hypothetical protein